MPGAMRSVQAPAAVVMVRPHRFMPNPETAADNAFQTEAAQEAAQAVSAAAYREVTQAVDRLEAEGVRVHLFEDRGAHDTPDSVFPNNWFSTHAGGHVAIYPMHSPSRRRERRADVIELLKSAYRVQDVIDYSGLEHDGLFLEGTGAMVLDHVARVAYTARSNRADPVALERFSTHFNFEPMLIDTADAHGRPIYHTNVLMCVATAFALVGFDMIPDARRAAEVRARLEESGREVIALSTAQIAEFAGNAIELSGRDGRLLALSQRACSSLSEAQKAVIGDSARLLPLSVPTIEMAGGSVRCMIAGIHLAPRGN
ncbi:citrulline utilization hydrolase CtlX [Variovorax boronicumulans]|uniref:citrulline utilization hydrolase CtlX n=1 Tax=Variovorax boronicumulans TaxID=436515 RepID=UPI00214B4209